MSAIRLLEFPLLPLRIGPISHDTPLADSLKIVLHPHPTLRRRSRDLRRVDAELKRIAAKMFDLMYEAKGIGLAANQVGLPLRMFVMNLEGKRGEGEELVLLNPVLSKPKGNATMEEGCLSLPGVFQDVARPKQITLDAYDLSGKQIQGSLDGMMSRCVQHEVDHLDGVLFIDRLTETGKMQIRPLVEEFEIDFDSRQSTGSIPEDDAIIAFCDSIDARYCS